MNMSKSYRVIRVGVNVYGRLIERVDEDMMLDIRERLFVHEDMIRLRNLTNSAGLTSYEMMHYLWI